MSNGSTFCSIAVKQIHTFDDTLFFLFCFLQEIAYTMDEVGKRGTAVEWRLGVFAFSTFAREHCGWVRE
jgi:hypothetical protein